MSGVEDMCCNELPKGKKLKISNEKENWVEVTLEDGTKVRYKNVLIRAVKTKGGDYAFKSAVVYDHPSRYRVKAKSTK